MWTVVLFYGGKEKKRLWIYIQWDQGVQNCTEILEHISILNSRFQKKRPSSGYGKSFPKNTQINLSAEMTESAHAHVFCRSAIKCCDLQLRFHDGKKQMAKPARDAIGWNLWAHVSLCWLPPGSRGPFRCRMGRKGGDFCYCFFSCWRMNALPTSQLVTTAHVQEGAPHISSQRRVPVCVILAMLECTLGLSVTGSFHSPWNNAWILD